MYWTNVDERHEFKKAKYTFAICGGEGKPLYSTLIACIGAATTFACKSKECLWQDWYILIFSGVPLTTANSSQIAEMMNLEPFAMQQILCV